MSSTHESQLIDRATRGDSAALGDLLALYQHRLYAVVFRMVNHRDDAAEITQDAMLKIVQHIGDFNRQSAISTWMIRIAMNLSVSHLRKRRLRRHASLDAPSDSFPLSPHGRDQASALRDQLADPAEPSPHQSVEHQESLDQLRQALDLIDDEFRAVLVLRDLQDMDYHEIASVLSLPLGTVKSRLFRARLALRQQMLRLNPPPRTPGSVSPADTVSPASAAATPDD